jgi:anti-sigma regulatory factor (Ser/Thr protein kinase)/DNA-binding NarL/FixJ family response regulator
MGRIVVIGRQPELVAAMRAAPSLASHDIEDSVDALDTARQVRMRAVDVVITDPTTPLVTDLSLVEEINCRRPGVKVIAMAPSMTDAEVVEALKAQVFACFDAAADHSEVIDMIAAALRSAEWREGIQVVSGLPTWITLRVSCGLMTADRLTQFMSQWRSELPSDARDLLMTAFREMLINAMEHGAGFDTEKAIEVTAARTGRAIVFHFRDPGEGFDHADLAHAAASSHHTNVMATTEHRANEGLRPGGFGMLIVRQIVDELVYNEQGNEVLMIKYVE